VLEAWDARKPVVASDAVALVENFKTGIITHKEPSSIAWGLNYVLEGLGRNRMGENGYDLLKKKYNWKTIAEKTFEVYEQIIEKQYPVMKTEIRTNSNEEVDGRNKPEIKVNN